MDASVYDQPVDPDGENAHAYAIAMVGGNKRVLEVGCGPGHVTRHLVARGNTVVGVERDPVAATKAEQFADRVVVVDLDEVDLAKALADDRFDVIVMGDVLEHLRDPLPTLRAARDLLTPDGCVVVSLPNVAHIDLRLLHLEGRWEYHEMGLLDRTHLRFYTRASMNDLVRQAGFHVAQLDVVRQPVFTTNLGVSAARHDPELVARLLTDPDAETFQFVTRLVPDGAGAATDVAMEELARLRDRVLVLEAQLLATSAPAVAAAIEADASAAADHIAELTAALDAERAHVDALLNTRTYRLAAPFRRAYARVRRRG